jgi:hypothetical protein
MFRTMDFIIGNDEMGTMSIAGIAHLTPVNDIQMDRALMIAFDMVRKKSNWPPILFYAPEKMGITGSHRIIAARLIVQMAPLAMDGMQIIETQFPVYDVTEYVDEWLSTKKQGLASFPYGDLKQVFARTPVEKIARQNKEW